jgi:hypothetical protein
VTPDEVRTVLAYASAIDPRIRRNDPDERRLQVAAWHAQLGALDITDARVAIDQHYAADDPPALMPGRLRRLIIAARSERVAANVELEPDADPDDPAAYRAALREGRTRAANGTERRRPVAELYARAFRRPA